MDETARKHTIKKQAFGELKNVIHNQATSKGLKPNEVLGKSTKQSEGLHHNACKPKNKQRCDVGATQKPAKTLTAPKVLRDDDIDMLEYFDYDRDCCRKPHKSEYITFSFCWALKANV